MVNFKAGDVVVYLDDTSSPGQVALGVPKVVQSVSLCGKYLRVHRDDNGEIGGYYAEDFALFHGEQDDPLPPAPESVRYATLQYDWQGEYNDQCLTVGPDIYTKGAVSIHIQGNSKSTRNKDMSLCVLLTPDEVLQLAHDLRRMAMEIKRKEKQRG